MAIPFAVAHLPLRKQLFGAMEQVIEVSEIQLIFCSLSDHFAPEARRRRERFVFFNIAFVRGGVLFKGDANTVLHVPLIHVLDNPLAV